MIHIGLDIGGTKFYGALFNDDGEIVAQKKILLAGRGGSAAASVALEIVLELVDLAGSSDEEVLVGVSVPGIAWPESGKVWAPNIGGWEDFPLRDFLTAPFGQRPVSVFIESDRSCHILGEVWKGAARGCNDAVFMAIGTGIGIGIISGGRLIRGSNSIAGAAGWMAVETPFREEYRSCGCLEYYASGLGLSGRTKELVEASPDPGTFWRQISGREITAVDLFKALEEKDPLAEKVISRAVQYWGMASANMVSIFNPEKIIWGGGIFGPALSLLPAIKSEAARWAQPLAFSDVTFEPALLSQEAGVTGAGYLAFKRGMI